MTPAERELVLTRVIDAPRSLVYEAWTKPEHVVKWWGPRGMTLPVCEMDVRPGGIFKTTMRDAEGNEYPGTGVFLDVVENELLVWTDAYSPGWHPNEEPFMTAVIRFEDEDGKTKMIATARHWTTEAKTKHEEMGFYHGWGEWFDRLDEYARLGKVLG